MLPKNYLRQTILQKSVNWKSTNVGYNAYGAYAKCFTTMQSCSEGQGFLMLICVYTKDKNLFDQALMYELHYLNKRGQMQWKQKFDGISNKDCAGASDGDLDILYALLLAFELWGEARYKDIALLGLSNFYKNCVNKKINSIIPVDCTPNSSSMRSADLMFDHFKLFEKYDKTNDWSSLHNNLLKVFCAYGNAKTAFLSEFILHLNGKWVPQTDMKTHTEGKGKYAYDSCRLFWRVCSSYTNVIKIAESQLFKANSFIKKASNEDPKQIYCGYSLDGIPYSKNRSKAFTGPFMVLASACNDQKWLDKLYDHMITQDYTGSYFADAVGLLCLLTLK